MYLRWGEGSNVTPSEISLKQWRESKRRQVVVSERIKWITNQRKNSGS